MSDPLEPTFENFDEANRHPHDDYEFWHTSPLGEDFRFSFQIMNTFPHMIYDELYDGSSYDMAHEEELTEEQVDALIKFLTEWKKWRHSNDEQLAR
jgi:hypothetical protein